MMNIRHPAFGAAAVLAVALATIPAAADVPADFKQLADRLADAVRQTDDDATLEFAGQLRALGQPLGNEINLIEAEALSRRHNNDAALTALQRYLAGKMRHPGRAKALKKELDARLAAPNKSWERRFTEQNYGTFAAFEDGTFYRVMTVSDDAAYRNMAVERYDATSGPLWRMVYGGSVRNDFSKEPFILPGGTLAVPTNFYDRGWTSVYSSYYQPSRPQLVGVDPLGRLTYPGGAVSLGSRHSGSVGGIYVPDGQGGFYTFLDNSKSNGALMTRFDASGKQVWSIPTYTPAHPISHINDLLTDDAGNLYVWHTVSASAYAMREIRPLGTYVDMYSADGQRGRAIAIGPTGNAAHKAVAPNSVAISGDGTKLFTVRTSSFRRHQSSGRFLAKEVVVTAYAFPSMAPLWSRTSTTEETFNDNLALHPFRDGVVLVSSSLPSSEQRIDYHIQRLDGASGVALWERKRSFDAKLKNYLSAVDVRPTGIFVASREGMDSILSFLSNAEVASLETDPTLEPPETTIWPFSNEVRETAARELAAARAEAEKQAAAARAIAMRTEIEGEYKSAEQAMRQCQLAKAAENGVGVLKTVDTDFGFVVIKMNTDFATNKDLSVVLADGRLAPLAFGKAPNKWEISAMPENAVELKAMTAGQVVVSKEGIPESKCPEQKIVLDAARLKMAELARAVAPAYTPADTDK